MFTTFRDLQIPKRNLKYVQGTFKDPQESPRSLDIDLPQIPPAQNQPWVPLRTPIQEIYSYGFTGDEEDIRKHISYLNIIP